MVELVKITFILVTLFILFAMYMTWTVPKTMQAAYWLILFLTGIAILFLLANSEVIFAFQISIYGGGISVLLLFAALLAQHDDYTFVGDSFFGKLQGILPQLFAFLLVAVNLVILSVSALMGSVYDTSNTKLGDTSLTVETAFDNTIGFTVALWTAYAPLVPFIALLMLTALLGSVKLVIREWELEDLSEMMRQRYETSEQEVLS